MKTRATYSEHLLIRREASTARVYWKDGGEELEHAIEWNASWQKASTATGSNLKHGGAVAAIELGED